MTAGDVVAAIAILAVAGWVLYRSIRVGKGRCPGCDSRCEAGSARLVSLGRARAGEDRARPGADQRSLSPAPRGRGRG